MSSKLRLLKNNGHYYCQHCNEYLSRVTYWRHRKKFFNESSSTWSKTNGMATKKPNRSNQSHRTFTTSFQGLFDDVANNSSDENIFVDLSEDVDGEKGPATDYSINMNQDCSSDQTDSDTGDDSEDTDKNNKCTNESDHEHWSDDMCDVIQDLTDDQPLPKPRQETSNKTLKTVQHLLHWFLCFMLLWQTSCRISDSAMEWLLKFIFNWLHAVGLSGDDEFVKRLAAMFPCSLYLASQFLRIDREQFTKMAVCPNANCCALYHLDQCTKYVGNQIVSNTCSARAFKKGRAQTCDTALAKKVTLTSGKTYFVPLKLYCFSSIINQVEAILQRSGVPEKCELWRNRNVDGYMTDVYDGEFWKEFQVYEGKDFLKAQRNLAFGINVDWFQPYEHRKDRSVGVIYLVILNLPREERYKWENIIVAGIIPELSKEPKSLNSFLRPVINEMNALWHGVRMKDSSSSSVQIYRAAIIFATADIPALRKLCGFKGHSAHHACSKCFKFFPRSFGKKGDYSGFDKENWPPRSNASHRRHAEKVRNAPTKTQHDNLAKTYGLYYSSLLELPYFDVIRFSSIDPMHNLYLGTSKHMFKLWIKKGILTPSNLREIEENIKVLNMATGHGRIPTKISTNYGSYTASQWKNWTLVYSMFALNNVIPDSHLQCWQTFVLACKYIVQPIIKTEDINKADFLFQKFGKEVEKLYGKDAITPNMHLHCHLKECVMNLGPVHVFWCFSFERFNGILGDMHLNGHSIEIQLMRKLFAGRFVWNVDFPKEFATNFSDFFKCTNKTENFNPQTAIKLYNAATSYNIHDTCFNNLELVLLPSCFKLISLDLDDLSLLLMCYKVLYPNTELRLASLSRCARKYPRISLGSETFGSKMDNRNLSSSRVLASWSDENGEINLATGVTRAGQVNFYLKHCIGLNGSTHEHVFACVWWHSIDNTNTFKSPITVWKNVFDSPGPSTYLPVQRILQTFASSKEHVSGQDKLVISPIPRLYY